MSKIDTSHKFKTDWDRVDALEDEDIDFSDCPEITEQMFANAIVRKGLKPVHRKTQVTLRLDTDILNWFKSQGRGYQTKINSLLRAYVDVQKKHSEKAAANTGLTKRGVGETGNF